mmetsp:Transcript_16116/g.12914  ORF Transcript_16116/g.12914 Transcript_16116/m.12914 type:complete len:149 (-) Transcript_16116:222-668(-)
MPLRSGRSVAILAQATSARELELCCCHPLHNRISPVSQKDSRSSACAHGRCQAAGEGARGCPGGLPRLWWGQQLHGRRRRPQGGGAEGSGGRRAREEPPPVRALGAPAGGETTRKDCSRTCSASEGKGEGVRVHPRVQRLVKGEPGSS